MSSSGNNSCSSTGWPSQTWHWRERALQNLTTILLSLFLPLSFLLLLRLLAAQSHFYDFSAAGSDDFLAFLFLYANSTILCALLTLITLAAFVYGFTRGRLSLIQQLFLLNPPQHQQSPATVSSHGPRWERSLSLAWLLLCTLLVFAELGIEFELNGRDASLLSSSDHHVCQESFFSIRGLLFVVGLSETTLYWSKSVVKPVVEDTVVMMGFTSSAAGEEDEKMNIRWVERVGLGLSFGALWWWGLRDHVDSLAIMADADDDVVKVADFVGFGLYYLTVCVGVIRAFTGVIWVGTGIMHRITKTKTPKSSGCAGGCASYTIDNVV